MMKSWPDPEVCTGRPIVNASSSPIVILSSGESMLGVLMETAATKVSTLAPAANISPDVTMSPLLSMPARPALMSETLSWMLSGWAIVTWLSWTVTTGVPSASESFTAPSPLVYVQRPAAVPAAVQAVSPLGAWAMQTSASVASQMLPLTS